MNQKYSNIAECTPSQNEINILGKNAGTTNIIVTEDNKNLETIYTITVEMPTLYDKVLSDNTPQSDASINFDSVDGNGLYYTVDEETYGEDGERIYYFRGRVDNNWVSFGGFLWRIVRTTSEEGVKLIYSGDGMYPLSGYIVMDQPFNFYPNNKYYLGYTYNTDLDGYEGQQTDSTIKVAVDNWYNENLLSYSNYLSNTAVYCADRSNERVDTNKIYYPAYDRLETDKRPTYFCPSANASRYTVSTETGNGYLSNPIALLTADEVNYAGIIKYPQNPESYLTDNAITRWWTMSPYNFFILCAYEFRFSGASLSNNNVSSDDSSVRPAISLKSCITVSEGNGNKSTPYILSDNACT